MLSIRLRKTGEIALRGKLKTVIVTAALILEQGKILVTQRKPGDSHELLWEFPGGKVKEGEDPREALQRELKEELDVEVKPGMMFDAAFFFYPSYQILLLVYYCRMEKGSLKPIGCHDLRWVTLQEFNTLPMPPADESIRRHLSTLGEGFL
jgi:8-oxo-dGTP diphosphatase